MQSISEINLRKHLTHLTSDIGVRLAGTAEETAACDYIAATFESAGAQVCVEPFPVNVRRVESEHLEVYASGLWTRYPCSLFSSTPGTDGKTVEAQLAFFEAPGEYQRSDLSHLRGKAVVHLGTHIESRENYRRLMAAEPACILFVDVRYPGVVPLADGMFPAYTRALGAKPSVNVAYADAWNWNVAGATAVRLCVSGGMQPGESRNVIATLSGTDLKDEFVYLGAHHDTQANSVGADDNASGVCGLLELARLLAPLPRRRTLQLLSFGAEEQLSVGSAYHVRKHQDEVVTMGRMMFNLDSYSSWMGWTELVVNGPASLKTWLQPFFNVRGVYPRFVESIVPYADHFPFVAAGIPGVYMGRHNCTAGRFFHHRPDDNMDRVSLSVMASHLGATAEAVLDALNSDTLPFDTRIPAAQREQVARFWDDLFGGW